MTKYETSELVWLAKRDNNSKRPYLYVNPLQGKHIPVSPAKALELFGSLAECLTDAFPGERLVIIGFAETATAIGAAVAVRCPGAKWYVHTTREDVNSVREFLYFSEVHSHASEQKLAADGLEDALCQADRVVFVEDEVTTGNTIRNLMECLSARFPRALDVRFGILSILNSMTEEALNDFKNRGIPCLYLNRLEHQDFGRLEAFSYEEALRLRPDTAYTADEVLDLAKNGVSRVFHGAMNPRIGVDIREYDKACHRFAEEVRDALRTDMAASHKEMKRVLVLGTEEFMYPCMTAAALIERESGCEAVRFHATTRSPILPSSESAYPLRRRDELRSVYDGERVTYVYNLEPYDCVVWLHDAQSESPSGVRTLTRALALAGCGTLITGRWGD